MPPDQPASREQIADLEFTPWKRPPFMKPGELLPSKTDWREAGKIACMAFATMLRTKEELGALAAAPPEQIEAMLESLTAQAAYLREIATMMDSAHSRIMIGIAAASTKSGE